MKYLFDKIKRNYVKTICIILFIWFGPGSCAADFYQQKVSPPGGVGHAYDVATGKPLANAWVIAKYYGDPFGSMVPGSHVTTGMCRKGLALKTDAHGEFTVPDWNDVVSMLYSNKMITLEGYKPGYQLAYHGDYKSHGVKRDRLINRWPYEFKKGDRDVFFIPQKERFTTESWLVALKGIGDGFCGSARYNKNYQNMYKEAYNEAVELLKTVDKDDPSLQWKGYKGGLTRYEYIESTPDDVCNYGLGILSNFNKRWPNGCPWPKIPGDNE